MENAGQAVTQAGGSEFRKTALWNWTTDTEGIQQDYLLEEKKASPIVILNERENRKHTVQTEKNSAVYGRRSRILRTEGRN